MWCGSTPTFCNTSLTSKGVTPSSHTHRKEKFSRNSRQTPTTAQASRSVSSLVRITVARGRGGGGPHPGLTGARPSPPPPSPAPPRGLTRDAPSRGGSSLPDPRAPHTRRLRAGHAHAAPYAYRAPPAHQRHAPRRGRAARAAPPLTQNITNYKSTKRVTPLYSAHSDSPHCSKRTSLPSTDADAKSAPRSVPRSNGARKAASVCCEARCVMIWSQLSIGSVVSSVSVCFARAPKLTTNPA